MIHTLNIILHVLAGTIALVVGVIAIWNFRRPRTHIRVGRIFMYLLIAVVVSGFFGWLLFRADPFLLMLTLVSGYVGFAGWRVIKLRTARLTLSDALVAATVLVCALFYLYWLSVHHQRWSPAVIYSTSGALVLVTSYDLAKFLWLHRYLESWWLYEHIYKMMSAFSALLSAFAGTVLPDSFRPYSQVGPSVLITLLIVIFIWTESRKRKRPTQKTVLASNQLL